MKNKVWIVGASEFGVDLGIRFLNNTGEKNEFKGFVDDREKVIEKARKTMAVYKPQSKLSYSLGNDINYNDPLNKFMFGTGDPNFKKKFLNKNNISFNQIHMFNLRTQVHKRFVMSGIFFDCLISSQTKLGYANFVDSFSIISHGCDIGNFNHIGVGCIIGGNTNIGHCNIIHSGAIIGNDINIGNNCTIGAGVTLVRDLPDNPKIIAPKSIKLN